MDVDSDPRCDILGGMQRRSPRAKGRYDPSPLGHSERPRRLALGSFRERRRQPAGGPWTVYKAVTRLLRLLMASTSGQARAVIVRVRRSNPEPSRYESVRSALSGPAQQVLDGPRPCSRVTARWCSSAPRPRPKPGH